MTAPRSVLLNPGPVTLSPRVRAALGAGDWCHREPEFASLVMDLNASLAAVYPGLAADYSAATFAGSGTAAVEGMLGAFAPDAGGTLVVANGVYGERMARMLGALDKPHRIVSTDWLTAPPLATLAAELDRDPGITHVAAVHHETTTGRLNDLDAIGALCRARGLTLLLDAVSSFGAEAIAGADWNLGALAATANKCLHGVPGLSFVLARRDLWTAAGPAPRSVYLDLRAVHAAEHRDGFAPFTLPVQVAFALREALAEFAADGGWPARRRRYLERAGLIHAALTAHGVATLLPVADYSSVLWSYRLPPGHDYAGLHDGLKADGFVIYAGQGRLATDIFRIAHMGDITAADLARLVESLQRVLGATAPAR
jgi:2-aminoethylphosphonate-pyruvate transaminase